MNMPHDPEDSGFCDFYVWTMFQQERMPYGTPDCHCLFDKLACCKVWFSAAVSLLATSIQLDWGLELAEIKITKRPVCFKIVGPTSRQTSRIILRPDWGGPLLQLIKIIQDNPPFCEPFCVPLCPHAMPWFMEATNLQVGWVPRFLGPQQMVKKRIRFALLFDVF